MVVITVLRRTTSFQHTIGQTFQRARHTLRLRTAGNQDIQRGDDAMRGVYSWKNKTCICTEIVTDHWLSRRERTTMRRASIDLRRDLTDHPVIPAEAGCDDQIVVFETVSINRAIGHAHTLSANASALSQYTVEVTAGNGECAESGNLRLLPTKPLVLLSEACIRSIRRGSSRLGASRSIENPLGRNCEALLVLTICSTMRNARTTSSVRYGLTIRASPSVLVRDICPMRPET